MGKSMKKASIILMSAVVLLLATGVDAQQRGTDCKDHPLFPTRMPDYRIEACKVEEHGVYEFWLRQRERRPRSKAGLPSSPMLSPDKRPTNRAASPSSATTRTPSKRWGAPSSGAYPTGG